MLTRIVLTAASVIALTAAANAADMYSAPAMGGGYKDGPAYVGVNWSGVYVGANVGAAFGSLKVTDFDELGGKFTNSASGVFGGGTLGYNFQRGNFVFGPEIDLGEMNLTHSAVQPGTGGIIVSKIDSGVYMDATLRLGYAFDRALVYAKGGYAYYGGSASDIDVPEATVKGTGIGGLTIGGGVEYKLAPAWSVKGEYQFFDFGKGRLVLPTDGDRYDNKLTVNTVKVGVNYFVGSIYEPLK